MKRTASRVIVVNGSNGLNSVGGFNLDFQPDYIRCGAIYTADSSVVTTIVSVKTSLINQSNIFAVYSPMSDSLASTQEFAPIDSCNNVYTFAVFDAVANTAYTTNVDFVIRLDFVKDS